MWWTRGTSSARSTTRRRSTGLNGHSMSFVIGYMCWVRGRTPIPFGGRKHGRIIEYLMAFTKASVTVVVAEYEGPLCFVYPSLSSKFNFFGLYEYLCYPCCYVPDKRYAQVFVIFFWHFHSLEGHSFSTSPTVRLHKERSLYIKTAEFELFKVNFSNVEWKTRRLKYCRSFQGYKWFLSSKFFYNF